MSAYREQKASNKGSALRDLIPKSSAGRKTVGLSTDRPRQSCAYLISLVSGGGQVLARPVYIQEATRHTMTSSLIKTHKHGKSQEESASCAGGMPTFQKACSVL